MTAEAAKLLAFLAKPENMGLYTDTFPARVSGMALPRFQGGSKVPPQLQRMKAEDLLATVFPDQVACLENIVGERQIPDHPLVEQTLDDCLHEAMDSEGWLALLRRMPSSSVEQPAALAIGRGAAHHTELSPYTLVADGRG